MRSHDRASLLVLGSLLLGACGSIPSNSGADAPPPLDASSDGASIVSLAVTKAGNGGGMVTSSPAGVSCGGDCLEAYTFGTLVTLTATPDAGSIFDGWKGGGCAGTDPCVVTLATDTSIMATFRKQQFTVTAMPNGNGTGSVTSNPAGIDCGTTCYASFDIGTQVTLTAAASAGATFVGWTGGGCTGAGSCTLTVTADTTVQPSFALNDSLIVTRTGNGTGAVTASDRSIDCGATCSHQYAPNTVVTLTAAAGAQSDFAGWAGAGCSGTGACVVTMTAASAVTAMFTLKQYTLQVNKGGTGTGTVSSSVGGISCGTTCSSLLTFNTVVTLTAVATNGSTFTGWSGGGCSGTGTCAQTITANSTVTASFSCPSSTFTYTGSPQTYVVPGCASQVHIGAGVTATHAGGGGGGGLSSGGGGSCESGFSLPPTCGSTGGLGFGGSGDSSQKSVNPRCYLSPDNGTAGGGGGYYGGGGTSVGNCGGGGGGGGSSYTGALTNPVMIGGIRSGNGLVIITPF